jgi:hypothetical protein
MKPTTLILVLFAALGFLSEARGQKACSASARVLRFEVEGKQVTKDFKVLFRINNRWIKSKKLENGFSIPDVLRTSEYLTFLISLGKYKLEFHNIHCSKFSEDWVVGIDEAPFSDEIRWLIKSEKIRRVHYIIFKGSALETIHLETDGSVN